MDMELIEKLVVVGEKPASKRRIFLSNIDLALVVYQESVAFFEPSKDNLKFEESCDSLIRALRSLLVPYEFLAGRLVSSLENQGKLEIDCNGAGIVVALAKTKNALSEFKPLSSPKPEFQKLVCFLQENDEDGKKDEDLPLLYFQFTQFGCGSLALASKYNHCALDGIGVKQFEKSLAALTRGESIAEIPNPDRSIFKARNPPMINYPHLEYSKASESKIFSITGRTSLNSRMLSTTAHLIQLSPIQIATMKKSAVKQGLMKQVSTFSLVAAKIWKARTIALNMEDDGTSCIMFPMNVREVVVPPAPKEFAGNGTIPAYAQAQAKEIKNAPICDIVKLVHQGMERITDGYVRSSIDWLEVNKGVPYRENSFSLVAWFKLGLEEDVFLWGKCVAATPIVLKPGLVFMLPGEGGGLNIFIDLTKDQAREFSKVMWEAL